VNPVRPPPANSPLHGKKQGCFLVLLGVLGLFGAILWAMKLPHAIITSFWPVETYYSVHAEIELDGKMHVLEGTGRCDWTWVFALFALRGPGKLTYYGGFLTKVLDDGRAIVIFPGQHCSARAERSPDPPGPPDSLLRSSTMFNQRGLFFFEEDLVTGNNRNPKGMVHDRVIPLKDLLPGVLVLDDARSPKTIRYYRNPKEHMATDCASLRYRSYRYTNTSSGTITRRELDVPYLANLAKLDEWDGYMARFVPFSTFDPAPWVQEVLERQVPYTQFDDIFGMRGRIGDWRFPPDWDKAEASTRKPEDHWTIRERSTGRKVPWRTIDLRYSPPREVAWDQTNGVVPLPPSVIGNCPAVTTLYPRPPVRIEFKDGDTTISRDFPPAGLRIVPKDRLLVEVERQIELFNPQYFERQP
jgi:hypothetical protein